MLSAFKESWKAVSADQKSLQNFEGMDYLMDIPINCPQYKKSPKKKLLPYFLLMANSVIQWNWCWLRPNFDESNNRGQQLEDLILKNYLILFNDKSHTGTFTTIDLTLDSPSIFLDFSWKVGPDPCGSEHFPIILENNGLSSLESVQRWKLMKANWVTWMLITLQRYPTQ